jgi:hypothetical protein
VECAPGDPVSKERNPHEREGNCNGINDLSVNLGACVVGDADDGENNAHARSPIPVSRKSICY